MLRLDPTLFLTSATLVFASLVTVSTVLADEAADTPSDPVAIEGLPDFSGDWVLNEKASDDVRGKMRELFRNQRGRSRGGGSRGVGGGRRSGRGGEGGPRRTMQAPPSEIQISHDEPLIVLRHGEGPSVEQLTRTNGTRFTRQTPRGEIQATASWDEAGRLEVLLGDGESARREIWELAADGQRLFITQEIGPDERNRVEIRRVYDRAEEDSAE
ncbi:MAG: hypothetical protein MPN21_12845 [Thermoanaerobaculia bacterium]|nr:hypothetical protein [Thermoanaerobaculia bacterium]